MNVEHLPIHRFLPLEKFPYGHHAHARFLVDRDGYISPLEWVRCCLKDQASTTSRQTILAHPFTALAQRPRHPFRRPTAPYSTRQLLHPPLYQPLQPPVQHIRGGSSTIHRRRHRQHAHRPVHPSVGVPRHPRLLQRVTRYLKALQRHLRASRHQQDQHQPCTDGGVERINHTMAEMLSIGSSERQHNRDELLPHAEIAHSNSVNAFTGLAPRLFSEETTQNKDKSRQNKPSSTSERTFPQTVRWLYLKRRAHLAVERWKEQINTL